MTVVDRLYPRMKTALVEHSLLEKFAKVVEKTEEDWTVVEGSAVVLVAVAEH